MRRLAILLLAMASIASAHAKQGICHTCKCDAKAEQCVRYCGSKKMCVMACAHDCVMKTHGIKSCPKPNLKSYN